MALSVSSDDCHWSSGYNGQHLSGGHPSNDITSASVVPSRPLPTLLQHSHSMHPDYEVPAGGLVCRGCVRAIACVSKQTWQACARLDTATGAVQRACLPLLSHICLQFS